MPDGAKNNAETLGFEAEVSKLLHLMVHSVYSDREIFLRELISNASDACDRLRYLSQTQPDLMDGDTDFAITITADEKAKTLTIADNGAGMNREELIENLGTIARSGTAAFVEQMTGDAKKDSQLIGQFGVGFYSSFMVADQVEVLTRKAGEDQAWLWKSDGKGSYAIEPAAKDRRGTEITLHLNKDAKEFLAKDRLETIIRTYSDHIAFPIRLQAGKAGEAETVNTASALWTRQKSAIKPEQYTEFFRHSGGGFGEPAHIIHYRAEGKIQYAALLFIPDTKPFDLFDPTRQSRVKLYVRRVFITDECEGLIPNYLRFLKGVVDSEDLPLNLSREMLQNNPILVRIRKALTGRVMTELAKLADKKPEDYAKIWGNFGPVIKEGIYEDEERRDDLLKLCRFRSTGSGSLTSLADYVTRMKEGQTGVYYVTGTSPDSVAKSPQLEGFRKKGVEVLLLSDPVDDFWLSAVTEFDGKPFKSITRGGTDLKNIAAAEEKKPEDRKDTGEISLLIAHLKEALGDAVKDVRITDRLTDSAVCLVADEGALDMHLERILQSQNQLGYTAPKILEINPDHDLIKALQKQAGEKGAAERMKDPACLLLDQALIAEGEAVKDPSDFARRMADMMMKGLGN